MNTTDLTTLVEDMRGRMADLAAGYGPTDQAGIRAMASWYRSVLLDAARKAVYSESRYAMLAQDILDGRIDLGSRPERKAAVLADEAWTIIVAGATGASLANFVLTAMHEATFWSEDIEVTAAAMAVRGVAKKATRGVEGYLDDVQAVVAEKAAAALTKTATAGVATPITGNQHRYPVMDIPGMEALVEYLAALAPAMRETDRRALPLKGSYLDQAAQRALDATERKKMGASGRAMKARRVYGAFLASLDGMSEAERVVAIAERETRIAAMPAHDQRDAREAERAIDEGEGVMSLSEEDGVDAVAGSITSSDPWSLIAPRFSTENEPLTGQELQVVLEEVLDITPAERFEDKKAITSGAISRFYDSKKQRADYERLQKAKKRIDIDEVREALAAVLA